MDNLYKKLSAKRKELQEQGNLPEWYTTAGYQLFQEKYEYDTNGKSVRGQFERIAKTAAEYVKNEYPEAENKFFNLLWNGWLSPSTPVLANTGTDRGMSVSCSGAEISDSVDGFYGTLHETAMLTKNGFGTSGYLGNIRPRGSKIKSGGKASGVLPVFKSYVQAMRDVAQGTSRRGAWAGYLEIDHGDFDELADYALEEPDDVNIGWIVTNDFINLCNSNDTESIRRFKKAMKLKMVHGRGYFCFIDKINNNRPEAYIKNNLKVKGSNLCVSPDTLLLTDKGNIKIGLLENKFVNVWNGNEWSNVQVKKTSENSELITVQTSAGQSLDCTEYHKFYVVKKYGSNPICIPAKDLQIGDKLVKFNLPIIDGEDILEYAYDNGFYSADGCFVDNTKSRIYLYHEKIKLKEHIKSVTNWTVQPEQTRIYGYASNLKEKFFVPNTSYTVNSRLEWFAGFCDGDGHICKNGINESLQIANVNEKFLKEIQYMLQTMGVQSKISMFEEEGIRKLPANDGTGGLKDYHCKEVFRLLVSSSGLFHLAELGFCPKRLMFTKRRPQRNSEKFVTVSQKVYNKIESPTYCFTEPKKHMAVFNGILTGNCDEITLFSDENHTFTCVLSSMNVAKWDEWKNTDSVYWATIFLDCIAEDFIQKAKNINGLNKAVDFTKKGRALGLGQCGFHTYLQSKMLPFESFEAHLLSQEIASHIDKESKRASLDMAEKLGEPEWCTGLSVRNTHRIAIAPTKSTALLMGGISEGINPDPAMIYTQNTAGGDMDRINPILLALMKKKGVYSKKNIQSVTDKVGSVQHVDWLTEDEKEVFKTAFEINQKSIIRLASSRKPFIDQWQSLNLFFASDESPSWIAEVHTEAFNNPNILGLYYVYTQAGVQAAKGECVACM